MFEPTNIAAEIIALTALGNSTLGQGQERIKPSNFRHVSAAGQQDYPPALGNQIFFGGPIVPSNSIWLLTHFSLYTAVEPPVNGTLTVNYGIGYNSITVSVAYILSGQVNPKASISASVQAITNRPILFVFPPGSTPRITLTETADPRTDASIGVYANLNGYFLPAAYQSTFQQFETQLKLQGT